MKELTKDQKQDWIAKEFLSLYNKLKESDYSIAESRDKPDFIIMNNKGQKLGLEVTEYTGYSQIELNGKKSIDPRTEAGRRKAVTDEFGEIVEERLKDYKNYKFCFYPLPYSLKKDEIEKLAEKVACEIKKCVSKGEQKGKFKIDDIEGRFLKGTFNKDASNIMFYSCGKDGVNSEGIQTIRDNFVRGLYDLICKKVNDAKKYENQEENILAIYENAEDALPIRNDVRKIGTVKITGETLTEKKSIDTYEEIWLLDGERIYSIY